MDAQPGTEEGDARGPRVLIFAGPNGAGKTTAAETILPGLRIDEFVNADEIASALGDRNSPVTQLRAGRLAIERIEVLRRERRDFAFETTLTGRLMERRLQRLVAAGYEVNLLYYALPTAEHAVQRVRQRVARGGHAVPERDVVRRFHESRASFQRLRHLMSDWRVYDARGYARGASLPLIAVGTGDEVMTVENAEMWRRFTEGGSERRRRPHG